MPILLLLALAAAGAFYYVKTHGPSVLPGGGAPGGGASALTFPYDPTYDYTTKPLANGPGPSGLDTGIPDILVEVVRKSMATPTAQLTSVTKMSVQGYLSSLEQVLASPGVVSGRPGYPIAAAVIGTRFAYEAAHPATTTTSGYVPYRQPLIVGRDDAAIYEGKW